MKILVSDFDDTLFTEDYEQNIKKINEFVDNGNMFIIATGRNLEQLQYGIKGKNIKFSYLICNDGGTIFDKELNLIYRNDINYHIVDDLIDELKKDENIVEALIDDGFNHINHKTTLNNAVLGRYYNRLKAQQKVEKIMEKYKDVHGYISHNWINITNTTVSKGNAIQYLVDKFRFNKEDIYTVGDNINDISMNEMFKGYYIKKYGKPELIEVSIGSTNSVKELIEKIVNNEI